MENQQVQIQVKIEVIFEDEKKMNAVYKSLLPETTSPVDEKRGKVEIITRNKPDPTLILTISSNSTSGVKALLNAYIYLLKTSIDVL